jgi:hypothetical protein
MLEETVDEEYARKWLSKNFDISYHKEALAAGVQAALEVMRKYENNHWWESDDPVEVVKYQVFEDVIIVNFEKYWDGLTKLLGRRISTHEFTPDGLIALQEEVRCALRRMEKGGYGVSDEYRETAERRSVQSAEELSKGKDRVKVVQKQPVSDRNKQGIDISGYDGWLKPE